MIVDSTWGGKLKDQQAEINRLQLYFDEHIDNSWKKLTTRSTRINTFKQYNISTNKSIHYKLIIQLQNIKKYVHSQMDTLAHTSWPYELNDPPAANLHANFGLAADTI